MISIDIDADGIALLTVDLKDRPMNVLGPQFEHSLRVQPRETFFAEASARGAPVRAANGERFYPREVQPG